MVLIIVGMHRSGTSLAANWLHNCGLNLGDNLLGARIGNEQGHFEDIDFYTLHERILQANNLPYGGLCGIKFPINLKEQDIEDIGKLVKQKDDKRAFWAWKEPRTSLFLDYYEKALKDKVIYLVLYREIEAVVDSLLRREARQLKTRLYNQSIIHKLKYELKDKWLFHYNKKRKTIDYADAWLSYNEAILNHLESIPKDRFRVLMSKDLLEKEKDIVKWLRINGFPLVDVPFSRIYKKEKYAQTALTLPIPDVAIQKSQKLLQKLKRYEIS